MRRADRQQRIDVFGHAQMRKHVAGVQSAHGVGDQDRPFAVKSRCDGQNPLLKLAGALFDAGGGMNRRNERRITGIGDGAIDSLEASDAEEAVVEDNGGH